MPMKVTVVPANELANFKIVHEDPDKPKELMTSVPREHLEHANSIDGHGQPHMLIWIAEQALKTKWPSEDGDWVGEVIAEMDGTRTVKLVKYTPKVKGRYLAPVTITRLE